MRTSSTEAQEHKSGRVQSFHWDPRGAGWRRGARRAPGLGRGSAGRRRAMDAAPPLALPLPRAAGN